MLNKIYVQGICEKIFIQIKKSLIFGSNFKSEVDFKECWQHCISRCFCFYTDGGMHDGFELVKRKKQRKRKTNCLDFNSGTIPEFEINFNKKLQNALEEFQSSQFCFELLQGIDSCLKLISSNSIKEILCFGIGNFLESKSSLHQLAALVKFHKKYNSVVNVYDPVFTSSEIQVLKKLNFNVLPDNEEGKRNVSDSEGILVFLPHCPKQLINNFLWANWNSSLCNCILISNSFSRIIQDNTSKALQESAKYILKIHPKTVETTLEDCYPIENIFNDLSIHCFSSGDINANFFIETLEQEPVYSEDIELIRKRVEVLEFKDEQQSC